MNRTVPVTLALFAALAVRAAAGAESPAVAAFRDPPESARPWVYWYFMDGNMTREGMTADLEAMKAVGLGGGIFLEVNVGVPRGPVDFMSEEWQGNFNFAVREADRLGLDIALGTGPGWTGSGGPWVTPEHSMQRLVASETAIEGPARFDAVLPRPAPREPFFGEQTLTPELKAQWAAFYRDVAVLAFPTPAGDARIPDIDEKALYVRAPFTSQPGVKPYIPAPAAYPVVPKDQCIARESIVDLTPRLAPDGRLAWDVPPGAWTILRFGRTTTGQTTRPAPAPGLGFECDKFSAAALDAHFDAYCEKLLAAAGPHRGGEAALSMLHLDSWEMGAQNWTGTFREDFAARRGYDLLPFLPTYTGRIVDSLEISERFLWDLRLTAQELIVERHILRLKRHARRHNLQFSVAPYDMNPCADLALGAAADVPMGEFWSKGYGFNSAFSCIEAVSIARTMGRPIVAGEGFTAMPGEDWRQYPGAMKAQTDWAFAIGINRIVFHTYQHQPWLDRRPGMTMGPYGVQWTRNQTWWSMSPAYHRYIARCQYLLRLGTPVSDILYLCPEGAPHVFRPPPSALSGDPVLPDRRGYGFDGCDPTTLIERARVRDGRIVFASPEPDPTAIDSPEYRILVLPETETMTPALLARIKALIEAGATVMGPRPARAPGLAGHPESDGEVRRLADALWGPPAGDAAPSERRIGKGTLIAVPRTVDIPWQTAAPEYPVAAEAVWIWHADDDPMNAPMGARHFRRAFVSDPTRAVRSARLTLTADNSFDASINARHAVTGASFLEAHTADVTASLRPGTNHISVTAVNGGDEPNPAGLVATLTIDYADGETVALSTDGEWESARKHDGPWTPARAIGPLGSAPWGAIRPAAEWVELPAVYGDYENVARVLAARGVPPAFESDATLRHTHRRIGSSDLFFVSNVVDARVDSVCRFRADGRHVSLWDPLDGRIVRHAGETETDGRIRVRLPFEPHGSIFVLVSAEPVPAAEPEGSLHPDLRPMSTLDGPWTVTFEPGLGAPASEVFPVLAGWETHADDGIRHFSGVAVYRKTFRIAKPAAALHLDLGRVEVMARVRLNGRDLGVVWTRPFRLDISAAAREGDNELEIEVANLWPNRLIGDRARPENERVTWTTRNPYMADSPLFPSGLLGPVRILSAK